MTYIERINRFWKMHQFDHFSSAEIAVFFYLLNIANRNMWEEEIALSTAELCASIGMRRSTIIRARQCLIEKGLIECREGVHNSRTPIYRIVTFATTKETTKVTTKVTTKETNKVTTKGTTKETLYKDKNIDKNNLSLCEEEKNIDEIEKILMFDKEWLQEVARLAQLRGGPANAVELLPLISEFFDYLRCSGVTVKTVADCRSHFVNKMNREYIRTHFKNKDKYKNSHENQRAIDVPVVAPEAYSAPF